MQNKCIFIFVYEKDSIYLCYNNNEKHYTMKIERFNRIEIRDAKRLLDNLCNKAISEIRDYGQGRVLFTYACKSLEFEVAFDYSEDFEVTFDYSEDIDPEPRTVVIDFMLSNVSITIWENDEPFESHEFFVDTETCDLEREVDFEEWLQVAINNEFM